MIQFFEEDNIEELEALQECESSSVFRIALGTVSIDDIIKDEDDVDENDVVLSWYESLW